MIQPRPLTVDHTSDRRGTLLTLCGELDYEATGCVQEALRHVRLSAGERLVLDLSAVTFCDSNGVTLLVGAHRTARAQDADLAVTGLLPPVAKVLRITGLDTVLAVYGTPEEAFADVP
ncbi:STAS domain-containing protein [Streptomyces indicus]|uniref:Anti-sigma factor antagonist n=1 Tax=Streptomyces indicus TaxID=417292 RepID=A0A1G8UN49_9ACTN|nr:STAS domain-containing protein [Streptomyces indicus]SDJ55262.1 anti-anti-sigma factor [Streptomyces indicus]